MSKLYYDDALAAAYMAREFGIKSQYYDQEAQEFKDERIRTIYESIPYNNQKFYIHPNSCSVFEPMVGDLVTNIGNVGWMVNGFEVHDNITHLVHHTANGKMFTRMSEAVIIQRNSKPFFTPLEVKDDS